MPSKNRIGSPFNEASIQLLAQIDDQIQAFEETIAIVSKYQDDDDGGYQRIVDFDTWIAERSDKYDFGVVPSFAEIAFVKSVLDVLLIPDGQQTERMVKNLCAHYCKDVGVRITVKGALVGQQLDTSIILNVLEVLGVAKSSTNKVEFSKEDKDDKKSQWVDVKIDTAKFYDRNSENSLVKAIVEKWNWVMESHLSSAALKRRMSSKGSSASLADSALSKTYESEDGFGDVSADADNDIDVDDCAIGEYLGNLGIEIEDEEEHDDDCNGDENDGDEDSGDNDVDADGNLDILDNDDDDYEIGDDDEEHEQDGEEDDDEEDSLAVLEEPVRTQSLSSMIFQQVLPSWMTFGSNAENTQTVVNLSSPASSSMLGDSQNSRAQASMSSDTRSTDSGFVLSSPSTNSKNTPKNKKRPNDSVGSNEESNGDDSGDDKKLAKRSISMKTWSINDSQDTIDFIVNAETEAFNNMSYTVYSEALALEQEEAVMRRILAQCGITAPSSSYRVGTSYLFPNYRATTFTGRLTENVPVTGEMLWDRCRSKIRRGKNGKFLDFKSTIEWGADHPLFQDGKAANVYEATDFLSRTGQRHFPRPLLLRQYDPNFYAIPPPPPSAIPCLPTGDIISEPDLIIRTSVVPWPTISKEFTLVGSDGSYADETPRARSDGTTSSAGNKQGVLSRKRSVSTISLDEEDEEDDEDEDEDDDDDDDEDDDDERSRKLLRCSSYGSGAEVLAPQCILLSEDVRTSLNRRHITSIPAETGDAAEDWSDEKYERLHEEGLAKMRDKWATISKLKEELRGDKFKIGTGGNGMMKFVRQKVSKKKARKTTVRFGPDGLPVRKRGRPPRYAHQQIATLQNGN